MKNCCGENVVSRFAQTNARWSYDQEQNPYSCWVRGNKTTGPVPSLLISRTPSPVRIQSTTLTLRVAFFAESAWAVAVMVTVPVLVAEGVATPPAEMVASEGSSTDHSTLVSE